MNSTINDRENKIKEKIEEAKIVRKIVLISLITIFIIVLGTVLGGYIYVNSALKPADKNNDEIVKVQIPIGSSTREIGNILEENGIIKNAKVFRYYVKFRNESGFQAGEYSLKPSMKLEQIIEQIKTGKVIEEPVLTITFPEGKQIEQMADIIEKKTSHSAQAFIKKVDDPNYIKELIEHYPSILSDDILDKNIRHPLEGYLYPATYDFFEENPSIEEIVEKMLDKTDLILSAYQDIMKEKNMSVHELLTMASLIEEEATENADREKIASVFYNRIEKGMPLQTDPTVLYALGRHQVRITYDDLKVNNPYNTYVIKGMPPGPIAGSGETSIKAALEPAKTDMLYFYARPSGEVIFTASLNEHNKVKNQYQHEWEKYKEKN